MIPSLDLAELQRDADVHGHRVWIEMVRRHGNSFRIRDVVMTCEPDAVRALLMDRPHVEKRPKAYDQLAQLPGGAGVLFTDGQPWLTRARALAGPFHRNTVDAHAGFVHAMTVEHSARWASAHQLPDLYDAVQQLGAATVLVVGYGLDPSNPSAIALADALVRYKQSIMLTDPNRRIDTAVPPAGVDWRVLRVYWIMWRAYQGVKKAAPRAIAERPAETDRPNWIARLVDAKLSATELTTEINHLYGAFNAIDYVATAALCELGRDPDLASRMRQEMTTALGSQEIPQRDDLERMPLTRGFMLEVMRRYPVSMSVHRQTGEPLEIGGETLPAGTQVAILLHALQHHPDFWSDPDTFLPERWTPTFAPKVPYSYVPFLLGARKCMGRDMAEQHLLLVVAAIIRRFNITLHSDPVVAPYMIPRFAAPIPFSLTPA